MKIGFLGTGAMGSALIQGTIRTQRLRADEICAYDRNEEKLAALADSCGIKPCRSLSELLAQCDTVMLAVKPHVYPAVLEELAREKPDLLLVTMAVGYPMAQVAKEYGNPQAKIIRTMPNTPCRIGEGVVGYCHTESVSLAEVERIKYILEGVAEVVEVPEEKMGIFAAIAGSMPAFVDLFVEAAADAAVMEGMPRRDAYRILTAAIAGSARLVDKSGEHPGILKDAVTSPGGTTIVGVHTLEQMGFRRAIWDAILATTRKSEEMTK